MTQLVVQTCYPGEGLNNGTDPINGWAPPLAGLVSFKITRSGSCRPGTLAIQIIYDKTKDAINQTKRFYPNLNIRVVGMTGTSVASSDRMYFNGRIDKATLRDDGTYGRVWEITARCWMGVLADSSIRVGRWVNSDDRVGNTLLRWGAPTSAQVPAAVRYDQPYRANYVGDYALRGLTNFPGEFRQNIIFDLCMNVNTSYSYPAFADNLQGIAGFTFNSAPNSKRIEWNGENTSNLNILDTVRQLAASDPWWFSPPSGAAEFPVVDGGTVRVSAYEVWRWFSTNNSGVFTANGGAAGIGAELQPYTPNVGSGGRTLEYYARGFLSTTIPMFSHGNPNRVVGYVPILSYNFIQDGDDVIGQSTVDGKGVAQSGGIQYQDLLNSGTWAPLQGIFRHFARQKALREQGLGGEWFYDENQPEPRATTGRAMRDASIAGYIGAADPATRLNGGISRGSIQIVGPPDDLPYPATLKPGYKLKVEIPSLGIIPANNNNQFILEDWTYEWPRNVTTISLSRSSSTDLTSQIGSIFTSNNDSISGLQDSYLTEWKPLTPTHGVSINTLTINHNLGVVPRGFTLEVGVWDQTYRYAAGHAGSGGVRTGDPIYWLPEYPIPESIVAVHSQSLDAKYGQSIGYSLTSQTDKTLTLALNYHIAYSAPTIGYGNLGWILNNSASTVYRVRVHT